MDRTAGSDRLWKTDQGRMTGAATNQYLWRLILNDFGAERIKDEATLGARILLALLFLIFGWDKLTNFPGTVAYMAQSNAPLPMLSAVVAITVEVFVTIAVIHFGVWTRPLAVLLAVYTLGTALIGHPYWAMEGADRYANMINFYKNISIIGGLILLYVTGPGKYSVDTRLRVGGVRGRSRPRTS